MQRYFLLSAILSFSLLSCQQRNPQEQEDKSLEQLTDMHQSRNSLDWAGHYFGLLPCADCEGIQTHLELRENGQFFQSSRYLGEGTEVFRDSGQFIWDVQGSVVQLSNADGREGQAYQVGENVLLQLDAEGNAVEGALADHYRLFLWDARLWNTEWRLHRLASLAFTSSDTAMIPRMRFDLGQMQVTGSGGCNRFSGGFLVEGADRLRFQPLVSTRMACPELETEGHFFKALGKVAFSRYDAEGLTFFDAQSEEVMHFMPADL